MIALPVTHIILGEEFDTDELRDIAEHGANTGVHGFTYSSDLHDMFDKYEDQIMDDLDEYCQDNFAQSAADYISEQLSHDDKFMDTAAVQRVCLLDVSRDACLVHHRRLLITWTLLRRGLFVTLIIFVLHGRTNYAKD